MWAVGLPSRRQPLFDMSSIELRRGKKQPHLFQLTGVAVDAIAEIGLVGAGGRHGRLERRFTLKGRQFELQIVFGSARPAGDVLAQVNGLLATLEVGAIAVPPRAADAGAPLQQGRAEGVTVQVHRSGLVVFHFRPGEPALPPARRQARRRRVSDVRLGEPMGTQRVGVVEAARADRSVHRQPGDAGRSRRTRRSIGPPRRSALRRLPRQRLLRARWNDGRGTHSRAEIAFTATGRRFFDQRAVARDLALLQGLALVF